VIGFLLRRLLLAFVVLLAVSFLSFWFFARNFYITPGTMLPISPTRAWWNWLTGITSGSLGTSVLGRPLWDSYLPPLGHTCALLAYTFVLVVVFALLIGVLSAANAGSAVDVILRAFSYLAWGVPAFLLALIIQKVLGIVWAHIHAQPLPLATWPGQCYIPLTGGFNNGNCSVHGLAYVGEVLQHLTLPAIALATSFIGLHARYVRSSMLVALNAPYTTTARAKGLPERRVLLRHALRNSLVTFVSALLLDFGSMFGAAMAVDYVFQLGGIGGAFIATLSGQSVDPSAVQLILLMTAALVLLFSLLAELSVAALDPRVRLR